MQCSFQNEEVRPDGSYISSICINEAKIMITGDPCYGLCYGCAYKQLQVDLDKANDYIQKRQSTSEYDEGYANGAKSLQAEVERLKTLWLQTGKIIAFLQTDAETFDVGEDLEELQTKALK